jgi:acetyl-CoA carboxylase carboxyl transferase subunit alpha
LGLIDGIIPRPDGGAHWDYSQISGNIEEFLIPVLKELKQGTC